MKYKVKSNSKFKKCFSLTATGKVKFKHVGLNHMLLKKKKARKNRLSKNSFLSGNVLHSIKNKLFI